MREDSLHEGSGRLYLTGESLGQRLLDFTDNLSPANVYVDLYGPVQTRTRLRQCRRQMVKHLVDLRCGIVLANDAAGRVERQELSRVGQGRRLDNDCLGSPGLLVCFNETH